MLPKEFRVQILFNNDVINELDAENPSEELLLKYEKLIENNTIKIKASMFMEKRKPGRPPKQKPIIEQLEEEQQQSVSDQEQEVEQNLDLEQDQDQEFDQDQDDDMDMDMDIENDFNENNEYNFSISSGREKKFTKRQLHSLGNLEEPLLQLPQNKNKSKKELAFTEEEIIIRSMKEIQRKEKLQRQQEEIKQQTVHKILNEVGRKQKQRQAQEVKTTETHKYRQLPLNDLIIKYKSNLEGNMIVMPHMPLVNNVQPKIMMQKICAICKAKGKYRILQSDIMQLEKSNGNVNKPSISIFACSLQCYKLIQQ